MKKFTVISMALIIAIFAGLLGYTAMSEDFVGPQSLAAEGEDPNAPVWGMGMDDLLDYMEEKGLWNRADMLPLADGVATEAYTCNNIELYWWDVENLTEASNEYAAYQDILAGEPINLYQQGQYYMPVTKNGPFAVFCSYYTGDVDALLDTFKAFGQTGGAGEDRTTGAWVKTLDELADYLAEQGVVDRNDYISINFSSTTTGRAGYRFSDVIDIEYYDLDNLDEASQALYDGFVATGTTVYPNGQIGYSWVNGPFTLHFYEWGKVEVPSEEEQKEIIDIFMAFGQE